jgi:uncharacterized membrane protein (DUF4010 family)
VTAGLPARRREARPVPRTAKAPKRVDKATVAWAVRMLLMPAALGAAFLTYYVGFLVMFVLAFLGVTVTAKL